MKSKSILLALTASLGLSVLSACSKPKPITVNGPIMGTQYRIVLNCPQIKFSAENWRIIALEQMNAVNASMSTYQADSELSQFNQLQSTDWQSASEGLLAVLSIAKQVHSASQGTLDPTVSKLVDLWGFGWGSKQTFNRVIPTDKALQAVGQQIGFDKLEIDVDNKRIRKQLADLHVDLSAVAKGYAVDQVSQALLENGCDNHLVDIGGELRGTGINAEAKTWRVGVEKPVLGAVRASHLQQLVSLNQGLASSGDYRNYYEKDGKRFSHTIDPRTYKPIHHNLASVTVIHDSTATADAWATALMVLGDEALKVAQAVDLAAYFIFRDESDASTSDSGKIKFITKSTKQFDKFIISK